MNQRQEPLPQYVYQYVNGESLTPIMPLPQIQGRGWVVVDPRGDLPLPSGSVGMVIEFSVAKELDVSWEGLQLSAQQTFGSLRRCANKRRSRLPCLGTHPLRNMRGEQFHPLGNGAEWLAANIDLTHETARPGCCAEL
jgi:hypothetical protein